MIRSLLLYFDQFYFLALTSKLKPMSSHSNKLPSQPIIATTICIFSILTANLGSILPSQASKPIQSKAYPPSGKLLQLQMGDLACYVKVRDNHGKKRDLVANFDICEQTKLLNEQVQLTYQRVKINDCQSAEPCGKTKIENAIVKMKLVGRK